MSETSLKKSFVKALDKLESQFKAQIDKLKNRYSTQTKEKQEVSQNNEVSQNIPPAEELV